MKFLQSKKHSSKVISCPRFTKLQTLVCFWRTWILCENAPQSLNCLSVYNSMSPAVTRTRVYSTLESAESNRLCRRHSRNNFRLRSPNRWPNDDSSRVRRFRTRIGVPRLSSTASRRVNQPERECTSTTAGFQPARIQLERISNWRAWKAPSDWKQCRWKAKCQSGRI